MLALVERDEIALRLRAQASGVAGSRPTNSITIRGSQAQGAVAWIVYHRLRFQLSTKLRKWSVLSGLQFADRDGAARQLHVTQFDVLAVCGL